MNLWNPVLRPMRALRDDTVNRIAAAIVRAFPQLAPKDTTQPNPMFSSGGMNPYREIQKNLDWVQVQRDCWEMYVNDGDIAAALDGIGLDASQKDNEGFAFHFTGKRTLPDGVVVNTKTRSRDVSPEQAKVDAVYDRLEQWLWDIGVHAWVAHGLAGSVTLGRYAFEVVWDWKRGEAVRIEPVPCIRDDFLLRKLHQEGTNEHVGWTLVDATTGERVRDYALWQLLVFEWNNLMPILTAARLQWRQLYENESDAYVSRKTRANSRLAFINPSWTKEQVLAFLQELDQMKRAGTLGPESDVAASGDVKLLDPMNAQLMHIDDLQYKRRIVHSAGRKPYALLAGYGADVNRDTLREQLKSYLRLLGEVNAMAARAMVPLCRIQLALWGYNAADYPFRILWTEKDEREFLQTTQAMSLLSKHGLSDDQILEEAGFDPDEQRRRRRFAAELDGFSEDDFDDRSMREIVGELMRRASAGESGDEPRNGNGSRNGDGTLRRERV